MPETRINTGFPKHFCCSRPTKNHPLVHPKIDLPGREKNKPLSLFITAILQHFLLYSTFSFRIQWPLRLSPPPSLFCLCSIQQSHLSLINQAFFLFSRSFSGLEKELGRAWEWDACEGDRGKKRSRARRISLKFIWLCFMFFMFFFTRTLGWVWVEREHLFTVLVPPRITLLSTRKSTVRDEKKPSLFPFS